MDFGAELFACEAFRQLSFTHVGTDVCLRALDVQLSLQRLS